KPSPTYADLLPRGAFPYCPVLVFADRSARSCPVQPSPPSLPLEESAIRRLVFRAALVKLVRLTTGRYPGRFLQTLNNGFHTPRQSLDKASAAPVWARILALFHATFWAADPLAPRFCLKSQN